MYGIVLAFLGCLLIAQVHAQVNPTGAGGGQASPGSGNQGMDIWNIPKQAFFATVMVASLLGWVLGMVKGFDSSKDWFAKYFKSVPKMVLFLTDLVIFVVVGAYIGTGLYQPTTFSAALAAGLTWPVALGALASKTGPPGGPSQKQEPQHDAPPVSPAGAHGVG